MSLDSGFTIASVSFFYKKEKRESVVSVNFGIEARCRMSLEQRWQEWLLAHRIVSRRPRGFLCTR